eukprot:jgi/Ulvmu1/6701/UM030_0033.1
MCQIRSLAAKPRSLARRPGWRTGLYVASVGTVAFKAFGSGGAHLPSPGSGSPTPTLAQRWEARKNRRITDFLILANVLIFALDFLMGSKLTLMGVKHNPSIVAGEWWRLLTCTFLHGGLLHVTMNMYALDSMSGMERNLGPNLFTIIYLVSGLGGSLASFLFSPIPSLGASGSVFGMFSATWMYFENNKPYLSRGAKAAQQGIFQTMMLNLLIGTFIARVDNWGHAGGFVTGLILAYLFGPRLKPDGFQRRLVNKPRIPL